MFARLRSLFRMPAPVAETSPFRFPEGRHGRGELRYQGTVPILRVNGSPEEVGEQMAILAVRPAPRLLDYPEDLLRLFFRSRTLARLVLRRAVCIGEGMLAHFPDEPRRELEALVRAGVDRRRAVAANTLFDMKNMPLRHLFGCSSLIVPPRASSTGGPLFGRNLDFFSLGYLHQYSIVVVYPPAQGRHGFAVVGFPGILGCFSGMNDAGLVASSHEVFAPPGPCLFNPDGLPFALAYRRILQECRTPGEALELLRGVERTTSTILALCDPAGGLVLEVTPDHVVPRLPEGGFLACTNHFLTARLRASQPPHKHRTDERLQTLQTLQTSREQFDLADVHAALHAVEMGEMTIQTMIFEPAAMRMHLGLGACPATAVPLQMLDLAALFRIRSLWENR
jgi:hypothetical protein